MSNICPLCGFKLVKKIGIYGNFLGCEKFPKCKYTESLNGKNATDKYLDLLEEDDYGAISYDGIIVDEWTGQLISKE